MNFVIENSFLLNSLIEILGFYFLLHFPSTDSFSLRLAVMFSFSIKFSCFQAKQWSQPMKSYLNCLRVIEAYIINKAPLFN